MKIDTNSNPKPDAIFFDCDGTLSQIEGINYLAETKGVAAAVEELTEQAMSQDGLSPDLYRQRLQLVKPTYQELINLADAYYQHVSMDAPAVIHCLRALNLPVCVISAGNNPAVKVFAQQLGIEEQCVFGVDLNFDDKGDYIDFNTDSPLIRQRGKADIIKAIRDQHRWSQVILVGDGMNDCEAADAVELFIGYGGNFFRQQVADLSSAYVSQPSFTQFLPMILQQQQIDQLSEENRRLFNKGVRLLNDFVE